MAKKGVQKGFKKAPTNKWDIVKDNELLRGLIAQRIEESELTNAELEEMAGIPQGYVSRYLHSHRLGMSQYHIIKLADVLGFKVSLDIEFKLPVVTINGNKTMH